MFKIWGIWADDKELSRVKRTPLGLSLIILFLGLVNVSSFTGYFELAAQGDTAMALMSFILSFAVSVCIFKVYAVWSSVKEMKLCLRWIQNFARKFENRIFIQEALKVYRTIFYVGAVCLYSTVITFCLAPIFDNRRSFPLPVWNPIQIIDLLKSPIYELFYIYESISIFLLGSVMIACDTFFCGIMGIVAGLLKTIIDVFQTAFIDKTVPDMTEEKKLKIFIGVIENFIEICRIIEYVQSIFVIISLTHFFFNTFLIALVLYLFSVLDVGTGVTFAMGANICLQIFQLGIYCYFGEQIVHQSRILRYKICECDWYNESKSFKLLMLLTLQRIEEEPLIAAGKLIPLSFPTFTWILKKSFTFYAFLYNIKNV